MEKMREIPDNVMSFLQDASEKYGRMAQERFNQDMYSSFVDRLQSPIEDIFYTACALQCFADYEDFEPDTVFDPVAQKETIGYGVSVLPQHKIGNYRVDFLLIRNTGRHSESVVVELDGHAFHDKDKRQRAYEKARDRFLVKNGYRVLHFTGSEVVADPYGVAYEALDLIGAMQGRGGYSKDDPLGIGEA